MITVLQKISSDLSKLHDIPKKFFEEIENTNTFGDSLFPSWSKTVFDNTTLRDKFEKIFDKYKAISDPAERAKIIQIFTDTNEIAW